MIIFFLLPLILPHSGSNLHQCLHGNRAGGAAQVVEDGGGGKFRNTRKIFGVQIVHGVQAAAGQKGILDAGGHKVTEAHFQIQFVQFLQKTVLRIIGQIGQTVTVDLIHGAAGQPHDLFPYIPVGRGAVPLFQGGEDSGMVFLPHLPQVRLPRPAHRAGVRIVVDIFQTGLAPLVFADDRDTFGTGLDPTAHGAVPQFHAGAGGGVRALGIDQELFIKRVLVEPGGRVQVPHPAVSVPHDGLGGLVRQLGYFLQFIRHSFLLYSENKTSRRERSCTAHFGSCKAVFS